MSANIPLRTYISAYRQFCKHGRNSSDVIAFKMCWHSRLIHLRDMVVNRTLDLGISKAGVISSPCYREMFVGSIEKRIIDTLVIMLMRDKIENGMSDRMYACRKGYGLSRAYKDISNDMRECSNNYTDDNCYVFKGDIRHFFISIDKKRALSLWRKTIEESETPYIEDLLYIVKTLLAYEPHEHCTLLCSREKWKNIPKDKSLFFASKGKGMTIGDLFSQWTSLLYLKEFGRWLNSVCPYNSIYMDDFVLTGNKEYILRILPMVRNKLAAYGLEMHPKKQYLQPYWRGVAFCGAVIKPKRMYSTQRTINATEKLMLSTNEGFNVEHFVNSVNSYFGRLKMFNSYNIRKRMVGLLNPDAWKYVFVEGHYDYFKKRKICL